MCFFTAVAEKRLDAERELFEQETDDIKHHYDSINEKYKFFHELSQKNNDEENRALKKNIMKSLIMITIQQQIVTITIVTILIMNQNICQMNTNNIYAALTSILNLYVIFVPIIPTTLGLANFTRLATYFIVFLS